jgi:hypothetical protein
LAGATTSREYIVVPQPSATLDTIRAVARASGISPALRGFEARRLRGESGQFIDDTELRKHDQETLSNIILGKTSGIRLIPGPTGATMLASSRMTCLAGSMTMSGCTPCFVTTYMDGMLLYDGNGLTGEPPDAARIAVSDLAGVEFYPVSATAPTEYSRTGGGCGLLLIWTREQ